MTRLPMLLKFDHTKSRVCSIGINFGLKSWKSFVWNIANMPYTLCRRIHITFMEHMKMKPLSVCKLDDYAKCVIYFQIVILTFASLFFCLFSLSVKKPNHITTTTTYIHSAYCRIDYLLHICVIYTVDGECILVSIRWRCRVTWENPSGKGSTKCYIFKGEENSGNIYVELLKALQAFGTLENYTNLNKS